MPGIIFHLIKGWPSAVTGSTFRPINTTASFSPAFFWKIIAVPANEIFRYAFRGILKSISVQKRGAKTTCNFVKSNHFSSELKFKKQ